MLTLEMIKQIEPKGFIAKGELVGSPLGINLTNSGKQLRFVATTGAIEDWAIYCHWAEKDFD